MDIFTPFRFLNYKRQALIQSIYLFKDFNCNDKRILVDVSELRLSDGKSGIQRVTTNILRNLYLQKQYEIVEIYAKPHGAGFFRCDTNQILSIHRNDIFFGLDLSQSLIPANYKVLKKLFNKGIPLYFFIHDLFPIRYPETVSDSNKMRFPKWLKTVIQFTGLIANSKATMDDVKLWLDENPFVSHNKSLQLSYVHLGADFTVPPSQIDVCVSKKEIPIFLMVSTVEPRKKYDQALAAFEILWKKNIKVHLQIVGRRGWNNEATIKKLDSSPFLNKTLFWYDSGISDEELADLYQNCSAVLFTSIAEGFGLAVVEAGYYKKPVILRDIPVFREIAGDNAFYFDSLEPEKLAETIEQWLDSYRSGTVSVPDIHLTSWKQCTQEILQIILRD